MFGAIHFWRMRPESRQEHEAVMRETLRLERERCPEALMNLAFGPAADGTCAEVQVYPSAEAEAGFASRVARDVPELQALWDRHGALAEPDSYRSFRFEGMPLLAQGFLRREVPLTAEGGSQRLAGRVALVTGAYRGNGLAIALAMAAEGADVALLDLAADLLRDAARRVEALGRRSLVLEADVTDEAAVQRSVGETVAGLGGLDILVNNAGVFPFKPIEEFDAREFSRVLEVNLKGPWMLCKYALPHLKRSRGGGGCVVNITSASGHYGGASPGGSAYDASKGGLRQLTYSLASEFGPHGVRVNAIAPGVIATEAQGGEALNESEWGKSEIKRTPLRRLGLARDVGSVAAFLASPDASYVNGVTIILDGGVMAAW